MGWVTGVLTFAIMTVLFTLALVPALLQHGTTVYRDSEVATWTGDGSRRATFAEVGANAARLAHALTGLGVGTGDRVGHGIGLHLHEDPYLGPTADQPLESGMVLGIEPLIYQTGFGFGMQNKDMVLVTERGCELLSDVTDIDRLIVVS